MSAIPQQTLSEHFTRRMKGRRLVAAVFTTYMFDPGFFESEVLPVFFDITFSHFGAVRLAQLEDALRSRACDLAVYYDRGGLVAGAAGARLDVRRHPVHRATGVFHPKNVFALVERVDADERGRRPRALLCGVLSANLTRAGWWENVEVAHVEEIADDMRTRVEIGALKHIEWLRDLVGASGDGHEALRAIRAFLDGHKSLEQRSAAGVTHPHFYDGRGSVPKFIAETVGDKVRGWHLEVISPYFDDAAESAPLQALLDRFRPQSVRVLLPRNARDEVTCARAIYESVSKLPGVAWASLPRTLLSIGSAPHAAERMVHAKVYRFFEPKRGGREVLFVGSANLTRPGFRLDERGGNVESGMLVERVHEGTPPRWLESEERASVSFAAAAEGEGASTLEGSPLILRYDWQRHEASAFWSDKHPSPSLAVEHRGVQRLSIEPLDPTIWTPLDATARDAIRAVLDTTSIVTVRAANEEPTLVLIQEEGMAHRPSILKDLSPAEILRYWSLLSAEQRAAFLATRVAIGLDDELTSTLRAERAVGEGSLFDRFAGVFHAFSCLEESVRASLDGASNKGPPPREAVYRLFGAKYDSLPTLLDGVLAELSQPESDPLDAYVVILCAEQLIKELREEYQDFFASHDAEIAALRERIGKKRLIREHIEARNRDAADLSRFLDWFERRFLDRARRSEEDAP